MLFPGTQNRDSITNKDARPQCTSAHKPGLKEPNSATPGLPPKAKSFKVQKGQKIEVTQENAAGYVQKHATKDVKKSAQIIRESDIVDL